MKTTDSRGLWALSVVAVIVAALAVMKSLELRKTNVDLRAENARLSAGNEAVRVVEEGEGGNGLGQAEKLELMRLRNEVTQLRASAQAARDAVKAALENRESGMRRVAALDDAGREIGGTEFRKEEWVFRGYRTPEDSLVSGMWAMMNGDLEKVVEGLSANERQQWLVRAEGKTEEEIRAGISREYGNVTAMKIKEERQVSPTELVMNVEMEGPGQTSMREMHFHLEGNEWKMQSLVNTYDPLSFYRRNPELMRRYFPHLVNRDVQQQQGQAVPTGGSLPPEPAPNE